MAIAESWKPRPGQLPEESQRDTNADGRPGPDAPVPNRPGPASYLAPERLTADTTTLATAGDGGWTYPSTDATKRAA